MKPSRAALTVVLAASLAWPAPAPAQEPVRSFDQLNTRLRIGDTVWVTDTRGREVTGRISGLQDASITLAGDGSTTLQSGSVSRIDLREKRVGRAAVYGLWVGGLAGAMLVVATEGRCTSDCTGGGWAVGAALGAGIGAGGAALVRAALPAGRREVYRAPGAQKVAVTVAPAITPRSQGLAVSFSF